MSEATQASAATFLLELGSYDEEDLKIVEFELEEAISEPFKLSLKLASREGELDFDAIVGQPAVFTLREPDGTDRYLHGVVVDFSQGGASQGHFFYNATIRPKLWLMTQSQHCRIFQDKDVPTILSDLLGYNHIDGTGEYTIITSATFEPREYTVQYMESDYDFFMRLIEEEGMHYYLASDAEHSAVIITDSSSSNDPIARDMPVRMAPPGGMRSADDEQQVFDLELHQQVLPGTYVTRDYDRDNPSDLPSSSMLEFTVGETEHGSILESELEVYEYAAGKLESPAGDDLAGQRLEAIRAARYVGKGISNCMDFVAGARFELFEHPRLEINIEYLITRVVSTGNSVASLEEDAGSGGGEYTNRFTVIPAEVPYRTPRRTPEPIIAGAQTATVTGDDEEIDVDDKGRIKVRFHWYREGMENADEQEMSCYIPLSNCWAGDGWGFMVLPRIDQEVIVQFLNGKPSDPVIIGSLYNGNHAVPNPLPDDKSKMTIRSRSLGGGEGFNELTFDDAEGGEEVFMHAEKDMNTKVKNCRSASIGADDSVSVTGDRTVTVEKKTLIDGVDSITLDSEKEVKTVVKQTSTTMKENTCITKAVDKARMETGSSFLETTPEIIQSVNDCEVKMQTGGAHNKVTPDLNESSNGTEVKMTVGGNHVDVTTSTIEIKVGGSTITVESGGIKIESSGEVEVKGSKIRLNC